MENERAKLDALHDDLEDKREERNYWRRLLAGNIASHLMSQGCSVVDIVEYATKLVDQIERTEVNE